ncbi:MAG TPA: pentapeptide repeat-containing protein, partial [Nitrososphaeraceae archaeon]|nr:pentapeptide repeat-containing protein [Nitrososphaeraceae archaeon]
EADVSKADLVEANLSFANLSFANLSKANLSNTDLSKANLSNTDLSEANLVGANLTEANLSNTDLSFANLSKSNLSNTDLSEANLASTIIIGAKFLVKKNTKCYPQFKNAELNDSTIIDDEELWRHLCNSNTKNVPHAVKSIGELRENLEQRGFDTETIDWFLSFSSLPDSSA